MIYTKPIEYKGLQDIKENIDFYYDKFIKDTILVFRNANLTNEEHLELQQVLGDRFGWFPNTTSGIESRYFENHAPNGHLTEENKDVVVLDWHVEHPFFTNPIVGALWNMFTFNIDEDRGKTYFVDTRTIYKMLPDDWQNFLNKCVANAYSYNHTNSMHQTKVIAPHWINKDPVIRMQLHRIEIGWHDLHSFDGRTPTADEQSQFIKIGNWIINEIINNEEVRIVHKWHQGDVVIPDLYCLAHAITGGFNPKDRHFTGLWSYQMDNGTVPLFKSVL